MGYGLALSAKEQVVLSLPHSEIDRQRSVNDFLSWKSGNSKEI